jgi:predicted GNAT family N-acyltransferase
MPKPDIRRVDDGATLSDAHAVRRAVFIESQGVPESEEMDGKDEAATHLVAYDGDRPVGTARLREPTPGVAKIERVAVTRSYRGQGLGRHLLRAIEGLAREGGMEEAVLHTQTHVADFYAALGYRRTGPEFEEAGLPHVEMRKALVRDSWTC